MTNLLLIMTFSCSQVEPISDAQQRYMNMLHV